MFCSAWCSQERWLSSGDTSLAPLSSFTGDSASIRMLVSSSRRLRELELKSQSRVWDLKRDWRALAAPPPDSSTYTKAGTHWPGATFNRQLSKWKYSCETEWRPNRDEGVLPAV